MKCNLKSIGIVIILVFWAQVPVINPDNVRPGDWFTPVDYAQQEADRQYTCRVRQERTGLECE